MSISEDIVRKLRENRILKERKDYSNYSRDELISMAKDGDQLAFETLVNSYRGIIKQRSSKYFLDTQDRDDIEQLITIAFWEAVMKWDMTGDFDAFLGMIIKRRMTDELRKDDTEKTRIHTKSASLDTPVASDGEGGEMTLGDTLSNKSLSPEEEYLGKAGARQLMNFIRDKLTQKERDVILLYIKGHKIPEIVEETGMSYKSVDNALNRVKGKISDYLKSYRESRLIRLKGHSALREHRYKRMEGDRV